MRLLLWHGHKILITSLLSVAVQTAYAQINVSEWIGSASGSNTNCLSQFYRNVPPVLTKDSLKNKSQALCFNGFNVMYSGVSKTPLWSAEKLTPQRLSHHIKRENNFHEETRITASQRSLLSDYRGSGYDRGHMSPSGDMPDRAAQSDSFSLANMVPQAPKNNQQVWRELEEATRAMVSKHKQDAYVVTGPIFASQKLKTIGRGVFVPTAVYKAVYYPQTGAIGAYYAPNDNSLKVKIVSVCYLEEKLGINLFPQLTEQQKRNIYQLPFKAGQVKAKKSLRYLQWDAVSQCAEDVEAQAIAATQKQFSKKSTSSILPTLNLESSSGQSLFNQVIMAVLRYVLQILR